MADETLYVLKATVGSSTVDLALLDFPPDGAVEAFMSGAFPFNDDWLIAADGKTMVSRAHISVVALAQAQVPSAARAQLDAFRTRKANTS